MKNLTFLMLGLLLFASSCKDDVEDIPECQDITVDSEANLNQFLGLWYEIASIPQPFNPGCECTTAEYSLDPAVDGVVVTNRCIRFGANSTIVGEATQPDPNVFAKLKVAFPGIPGAGDYWILEFGSNADYMLVGDPAKTTLFILAKTSTLDDSIYDELIQKAEDFCFDISTVVKTTQTGC